MRPSISATTAVLALLVSALSSATKPDEQHETVSIVKAVLERDLGRPAPTRVRVLARRGALVPDRDYILALYRERNPARDQDLLNKIAGSTGSHARLSWTTRHELATAIRDKRPWSWLVSERPRWTIAVGPIVFSDTRTEAMALVGVWFENEPLESRALLLCHLIYTEGRWRRTEREAAGELTTIVEEWW